MIMRVKSILFIGLVSLLSFNAFTQVDVIYGADNRHEVDYSYLDSIIKSSSSIAIRVPNRRLHLRADNSGIFDILKIPLKNAMPNLCSTERFSDQYQLGDCTGFLIAKNRILTAGHCAFSNLDCENNSWVFNFKEGISQFTQNEVYKCSKKTDLGQIRAVKKIRKESFD
jgi:hypothetical protein